MRKIFLISALLIGLTFNYTAMGQDVPPPPPPGHGQTGNQPADNGGSAPIGGGLL